MPKTAALRAAVVKLFTKNLMGGCSNTPPPAGRGLRPREVVAERHVEGYALSGALQPQGAALLGQAVKARGR